MAVQQMENEMNQNAEIKHKKFYMEQKRAASVAEDKERAKSATMFRSLMGKNEIEKYGADVHTIMIINNNLNKEKRFNNQTTRRMRQSANFPTSQRNNTGGGIFMTQDVSGQPKSVTESGLTS